MPETPLTKETRDKFIELVLKQIRSIVEAHIDDPETQISEEKAQKCLSGEIDIYDNLEETRKGYWEDAEYIKSSL